MQALGRYNFFGQMMSQHPNAPRVINDFLFDVKPKVIIELGTYLGGLSVMLQMYAMCNGAKFTTYDVVDRVSGHLMFKTLNIDFRKKDVFADEVVKEVVGLLDSVKPAVLFCDNGSKIKEFNLLAPYLKSGDFILAHDYASTQEYFQTNMNNNKVWNWCEIKDSDIELVSNTYQLEPFMKDEMQSVAWVCKRKK